MKTTKAGVIALALATLITATTGCDPDEGQWVGPHRRTDPGPRTAVIADSLVDEQDALWQGSRLAKEGPIAINSVGGTLYHDHRAWIAALRPVPDRVIVALGTNNAWNYPPLDGWHEDDEAAFTRLIHTIRSLGIDCIVVTTIGHQPSARASYRTSAHRANAFLTSFVAGDTRGDLRLADWAAVSRGRTDFYTDEVHHTPSGARAYHVVSADAARSCG